MKKHLFLVLMSANMGFAQQSVSLDSCIVWAKQHYPQVKQTQLVQELSRTSISAINENWTPHLTFSANGTYQSEVVEFNFPGMNVSFPHDSYMASVNLDQTLYDGGQTRQQKQVEHLNTDVEVQRNEVELYKLVERVSQLYVNTLLARENLKVLDTYKNNIDNRRESLSAAAQNGLALESSLDELEAESLETDQSIIEAKNNLAALYRTLEFFTGHPFGDATPLDLMPAGGVSGGDAIVRPELKLLDLQQELLESRFRLTNKYALPRVSVFGGANYGRPGPNFINQDLRFFGSAGIGVKWNISSLYGLSREKTRYNLNTEMINVQREVFLFNINSSLATQMANIQSMREVIEKDKTIVEKRHNVTVTASAQLENGKITVTDYLTELNSELQAVLSQKIHEIRLMNAQSTYNTTKGITNF